MGDPNGTDGSQLCPEPRCRKEILLRLSGFLEEKDIVVAALAGTTNECFQTMHRPMNLYLVGMGMVTPVSFGLAGPA